MSKYPRLVLVLEPDDQTGLTCSRELQREGIRVDVTNNFEAANSRFLINNYQVAVVSINVPPHSGFSILQRWRERCESTQRSCGFVLLVGESRISKKTFDLLSEIGGASILTKPIKRNDILNAVMDASRNQTEVSNLVSIQQGIFEQIDKGMSTQDAVRHFSDRLDSIEKTRKLKVIASAYERALDPVSAQIYYQMLFDDAKKQGKIDLEASNNLARMLLLRGEPKKAREILANAEKFAESSLQRLTTLAQSLIQMGHSDEALEKIRHLLNRDPDKEDRLFKISGELLKSGYEKQAVAIGDEFASGASAARFYNNMGVTKAIEGKYDDALKYYRRALELSPHDKVIARIYFNSALSQIRRKKAGGFAEAEKCLHEAFLHDSEFQRAKELLPKIVQLKKRELAGLLIDQQSELQEASEDLMDISEFDEKIEYSEKKAK